MVNKNILFASVLKPCDDSRIFEKMAKSIAQLPGVTVHIIGHKVNRKNITPNIKFYPIFSFHRLSFLRLFASWKYAIYLLKVKPDIIIVNTHELLLVTIVHKIIFGTEIYYDVQENYYQNIALTHTFSKWFRFPLAYFVRFKEIILSPLFDCFILAEACYVDQMRFLKGRPAVIIENKFALPSNFSTNTIAASLTEKIQHKENIRFVFSGTIAEEYGIFEAIDFIKKWIVIYPNAHLDIIGYCAKSSTWKRIQEEISNNLNITVYGGAQLVPHAEILEALKKADIALLPYRPLEYTKDRIPTKLYECLAYQLPMVIQENHRWEALCSPWEAGIFIDFSNPDIDQIYNGLSQKQFYSNGQPTDIFWESESQKLIKLFIKA